MHYGATPAEWGHLSRILGYTEDLLPCVSNPNAVISPMSKMAGVGKTPSRYNGQHQVVGFPEWTQHRATEQDIKSWSRHADYGICVITGRHVVALDVDIADKAKSDAVAALFMSDGIPILPCRSRGNSGKQLFIFEVEGNPELYKRAFKVDGGLVEFLALGQQFIAVGTHTSGATYEWRDGLPVEVPSIPLDEFELAWERIVKEFAIEEPRVAGATSKAAKLEESSASDPIAQRLQELGMVLSQDRSGRIDITCPFSDGHSTESSESSTSYYPPNTGGYARGHFKCLHASCNGRTDLDFEEKIGLGIGSDFEDLTDVPVPLIGAEKPGNPLRFQFIQAALFANSPRKPAIIKHVLPQVELAIIFGAPASGKSFMAIDIACHVALNIPWRGYKVNGGTVAYIAAEGATGCEDRMKAYAQAHGIDLKDLKLHFLPTAPNFMSKTDITDLIAALISLGPLKLVVVDTLARVTAGANENSGEDMGTVIKNCGIIHSATGATVLLVHHSGKDAAAGVRGWSGIGGAAEAIYEVIREREKDEDDEDDEEPDLRWLNNLKQKDDKDGGKFPFQLNVVPIGMDEDDEIINSCYVQHLDKQAAMELRAKKMDKTKERKKKEASPAEADMLVKINELHAQSGHWPWIEDMKMALKAEGGDVRHFNRTIASLVEKGQLVKTAQDYLEIPPPPDLI